MSGGRTHYEEQLAALRPELATQGLDLLSEEAHAKYGSAIPKGWVRLHIGDRLQEGDKIFSFESGLHLTIPPSARGRRISIHDQAIFIRKEKTNDRDLDFGNLP